jgi:excisionase family DNA binding protein
MNLQHDALLERAMTVQEVADRVRSTKAFISSQIDRQHLRAIRIGGKFVRIMPEDFQAWLDSFATKPLRQSVGPGQSKRETEEVPA